MDLELNTAHDPTYYHTIPHTIRTTRRFAKKHDRPDMPNIHNTTDGADLDSLTEIGRSTAGNMKQHGRKHDACATTKLWAAMALSCTYDTPECRVMSDSMIYFLFEKNAFNQN